MAVTLQQIAERVGVSKQAVSYALNGKAGQVSESTRSRILSAAKSLDYQPNYRARSFARRRSQVIGLIYGRPAEYVERSRMVSELVERLAELDHELMLIPAVGPVERWANKLRDGRVDGCLVTHPLPLGLDTFIEDHRLPAVFFNLRSEGPVPQVCQDDAEGADQMMDHLLGLGHRRVWFFCTPKRHGEHHSNAVRREAYCARMQAAGLTGRVVRAEYEELVDLYQAAGAKVGGTGEKAGGRPTAVLAYNDHDAIRAMQAFWKRGIRVPDELSIAGFDDDAGATETIPPLTTVASPNRELARRGVELLMDRIEAGIEGRAQPPSEPVILTQHLVIRESTRPPGPPPA